MTVFGKLTKQCKYSVGFISQHVLGTRISSGRASRYAYPKHGVSSFLHALRDVRSESRFKVNISLFTHVLQKVQIEMIMAGKNV